MQCQSVTHTHRTLRRNARPTVTQMILFLITVIRRMGSPLILDERYIKGQLPPWMLPFPFPLFLRLSFSSSSFQRDLFPFTAGYTPLSLPLFTHNGYFLTYPKPKLELTNISFVISSFFHTLLPVYLTNTQYPVVLLH